jgi:hypothetical protein
MSEPAYLVRVQSPYFCAGLVLHYNVCVRAAPILAWAIGRTSDDLEDYFTSRQWVTTTHELVE